MLGRKACRKLVGKSGEGLGESKYEKYWWGGEKWKEQRHRAQRTMGAYWLSTHVRPKALKEPWVVNHQSCTPFLLFTNSHTLIQTHKLTIASVIFASYVELCCAGFCYCCFDYILLLCKWTVTASEFKYVHTTYSQMAGEKKTVASKI